jgi:hypothetical protein
MQALYIMLGAGAAAAGIATAIWLRLASEANYSEEGFFLMGAFFHAGLTALFAFAA